MIKNNILKNKKGFTLIELLAVIVILGIVMTIALVTYTSQINNSKLDGFISSAQSYGTSISDMMLSNGDLPGPGSWSAYSLANVELSRGGQSSFDSSDYHGIVYCYNSGNTIRADYQYYIYLVDQSGNYLFSELKNLGKSKKIAREYVKTGGPNIGVSEEAGNLSGGPIPNPTDGTTLPGSLPTTGIMGGFNAYTN